MTLIEHLIAKAVQQHTPVPGLTQGGWTLSTDAGGAVFCDLVVPGRVKMQLVQAIDVLHKTRLHFTLRHQNPIEIDVFVFKVGAQPHHIALVSGDVNKLILSVKPGNGGIALAASNARFNRKTNAALRSEIEGEDWVGNQLRAPVIDKQIQLVQVG